MLFDLSDVDSEIPSGIFTGTNSPIKHAHFGWWVFYGCVILLLSAFASGIKRPVYQVTHWARCAPKAVFIYPAWLRLHWYGCFSDGCVILSYFLTKTG